MVRIYIRMLRIPFKWFEFGYEWLEWLEFVFESLLNGSTPFRVVQICIRMFQIWFQWLVFGFECFESLSNGLNLDSNASNLDSNASNPFRIL